MRARIFAEDTRKWFSLAAVSFGLFMMMLDGFQTGLLVSAGTAIVGALGAFTLVRPHEDVPGAAREAVEPAA